MEEDLELWQRWRQCRDQQAFAALYNRHLNVLVGVARRCLGEQFLRREAHRVQEAIGETWLRLERVAEVSGPLAPLLVTIFRHVLVDEFRRDRGRREQPGDAVDQAVEPRQLDDLIAAEDRQRLQECLANLPPQHRETYRLLFLEGRTLEDAAAQMGLASPSGAWARRRQLIAWLADCMSPGPEPE